MITMKSTKGMKERIEPAFHVDRSHAAHAATSFPCLNFMLFKSFMVKTAGGWRFTPRERLRSPFRQAIRGIRGWHAQRTGGPGIRWLRKIYPL